MKMQAPDGETLVVKFWHEQKAQVLKTEHRGQVIVTPVAGYTACVIEREDAPAYLATAYCSTVDQFSKATGRKVAFTRALRGAGFDKQTRTALWTQYWKQVNPANVQ